MSAALPLAGGDVGTDLLADWDPASGVPLVDFAHAKLQVEAERRRARTHDSFARVLTALGGPVVDADGGGREGGGKADAGAAALARAMRGALAEAGSAVRAATDALSPDLRQAWREWDAGGEPPMATATSAPTSASARPPPASARSPTPPGLPPRPSRRVDDADDEKDADSDAEDAHARRAAERLERPGAAAAAADRAPDPAVLAARPAQAQSRCA
jgi:hypothetical protein